MRRKLAVAVGAPLALGACVPGLTSAPEASRVTAPADWRIPLPGEAAIERDWWTAFGDPHLTALVEQARANNPDIAVAIARVDEARARERVSRSYLVPSLVASTAGSEARSVNAFGNPSESFGAQGLFQASYELDLFGKNRAQLESSEALTGARQADEETVRLSVSATTASGYVTLLALDRQLEVLRDTLKARAEALKIARDRTRAGYSSQLDLSQAEAEYRSTEQQIPAIETTIAQQENALSMLVGDTPHGIERGTFAALSRPSLPQGVPSELLRRRPDIAQAEYTLASSDAQMRVARAQFMPQISLAASGGGVYSSLLDDVISIWSIGGSILAPIFEGGRLRGQFDAATAVRDQSAFAYRKTVLNAFREVEDRRAVLANLDRQETALVAQRDATADALQHAIRRYRAGYSPYLEQIDAQRALLAVEISLVQLRANRLTSTIALYQALGGGYEPGS